MFVLFYFQETKDICGESALHVAIKKGDFEKIKSLIDENDADVNMKDNAGEFSI